MIKQLLITSSLLSIPICATTPIVLFDIHDVILQPQWHAGFWQSKYKWNALQELDQSIITAALRYGFSFMPGITKPLGEEFLFYAEDKPALRALILECINAQTPIESTVDIIKKLHALNIPLHLGSNISKTAFFELIQQEPFATIFNYFDLEKSKFITYTPGTKTVAKPDTDYFSEYINNLNTTHAMNVQFSDIIFVDDRIENIYAADELGMRTIWFQSAAQLQQSLEQMLGHSLDQYEHLKIIE